MSGTMSSNDLFYLQGSSYSDHDRAVLRNRILGHCTPSESSDSMFGSEQYQSYQTMDFTAMMESPDSVAPFAVGNDVFNYSTESFQYNSADSMFEDNYFNHLETASTNTSYAPSQYDGDNILQSPTSPAFSAIMSASSGPVSAVMSPEILGLDVASSPSDCSDDLSEETRALDMLLSSLEAAEDGKYHCDDVGDELHSCDYVADRKCMLRKHLESTLKTNACRHAECNGARFSSKAVLTRHEKEAHGMHAAHQFFCPISTCERATRGFPREYNMGDHISRVHRELDVNQYLKKNKRARKQSTGNASINTTPTKTIPAPSGVRKSSGSRARREKLEKQYKQSRTDIITSVLNLPERGTSDPTQAIEGLRAEIARLETCAAALAAQAPSSND